jgi:hypothetical protein
MNTQYDWWNSEDNSLLQKNGLMWLLWTAGTSSSPVDPMLYSPNPIYERIRQRGEDKTSPGEFPDEFLEIDFNRPLKRYIVFQEWEDFDYNNTWSTLEEVKEYLCSLLKDVDPQECDAPAWFVVDLSKMYFDFSKEHPVVQCSVYLNSHRYKSIEALLNFTL